MTTLPLFPLGTVLMPGMPLPLQVFEPRYLSMLADLAQLESSARRFVIVGISRGHEVGDGEVPATFDVGCTARVEAAGPVDGAPSDAPRMALVVRGIDRVRLDRILTPAETQRPYLCAEVSPMPDGPDGDDPSELAGLAERLTAAFLAYRRALGAPDAQLGGPPEDLAGQVVRQMALGITERQGVLEAPHGAERLRLVLAAVQRERDILQTFGAVPTTRSEVNPN